MRNPGIALLLMVSLLAGQAIPLRHSHAEGEAHSHHGAAHFHLHGHSSVTRHHHNHESDHDAHGHDRSALTEAPSRDHDDDAVYVGDFVAVISDGNSTGAKVASPHLYAWSNFASLCSACRTPPDAVALPPPQSRPDGISIYLRAHSLRI